MEDRTSWSLKFLSEEDSQTSMDQGEELKKTLLKHHPSFSRLKDLLLLNNRQHQLCSLLKGADNSWTRMFPLEDEEDLSEEITSLRPFITFLWLLRFHLHSSMFLPWALNLQLQLQDLSFLLQDLPLPWLLNPLFHLNSKHLLIFSHPIHFLLKPSLTNQCPILGISIHFRLQLQTNSKCFANNNYNYSSSNNSLLFWLLLLKTSKMSITE